MVYAFRVKGFNSPVTDTTALEFETMADFKVFRENRKHHWFYVKAKNKLPVYMDKKTIKY